MDELPSITESPVPDVARLVRCSAGRRGPEAEIYGPPEPVLALGRWLRSDVAATVDLAGPDRDGWQQHPGSLEVAIDEARAELVVSVVDGRLVLSGAPAVLDALGEVVQDVGVKALDWRWAPTERRAVVGPMEDSVVPCDPASLILHVVSAYPL
ncbi:MAG: hypothetical protein JJU45_16620 [Acidimicrobiia bacterium]|nr:hypothetical protein [Acidimicrobiia bacterium]